MARPSSSTSSVRSAASRNGVGPSAVEAGAGGLFGFLARGGVAVQVGDAAWLRAMLDVEAAIARAEVRAGLIPARAADDIAAAAADLDAGAIGREAAATGNPVPPLVALLTNAVARDGGDTGGDSSGYVHLGATSQDVMDTATMLVITRAAVPLLDDLAAASDAAAGLAARHRATLMVGRTLLQQALPTTFGVVAAGWLSGLDRAGRRLDEAIRENAAVQLGGAVGTLASLGDDGLRVVALLAEELHLAEPIVPWHTDRTRVVELSSALAEVAGAAAKVALDIVLLAQTETDEVREAAPGRGGSSTLPQKRNPIAAVTARACAARAPGLAATLFASMPQELQRSAGGWQSEWITMSQLLVATGSAVAWLRDSLENLEVDEARMRANLDAGSGLAMAEHVTIALSASLGRLAAHKLVEAVASDAVATGRPFGETLAGNARVADHLDRAEIARLLDPTGYLGSANVFVERALAAHDAQKWHQ